MAKEEAKKHPFDEIEMFMGEDFVFFFLLLIGYPDPKPGEILLTDFGRYRFKNLNNENLCKTLILLEEDDALEIEKLDEKNDSIIKITDKTISFIEEGLDIYLKRFINGKLISSRITPYNFRKQKKIFLEKIEGEIEDSQETMILSDADLGERCNFIECMLALEKQRLIKIRIFYNESIPAETIYYRASFEITDKLRKQIGKCTIKENHTSKCIPRGSIGYFQIKKGLEPKEIGPINSIHYLLLDFLFHQAPGELVDFKKAFSAIKNGNRHTKIRSAIVDEELRVLRNAVRCLQKAGKIGRYRIRLSEKQRKIWVE